MDVDPEDGLLFTHRFPYWSRLLAGPGSETVEVWA
jgi:hypothetical protein